jgi:hypothetical protein
MSAVTRPQRQKQSCVSVEPIKDLKRSFKAWGFDPRPFLFCKAVFWYNRIAKTGDLSCFGNYGIAKAV